MGIVRKIKVSLPVPLKDGRPDILREAEVLDELQEVDPQAQVSFEKDGIGTLLFNYDALLSVSLQRLLS